MDQLECFDKSDSDDVHYKIDEPNVTPFLNKADPDSKCTSTSGDHCIIPDMKNTDSPQSAVNVTESTNEDATPVIYHSKVSPEENSIKLCIRKSTVSKEVKKKSENKKSKPNDFCEDGDVLMIKNESVNAIDSFDGWGKRLPIDVLVNIFSLICNEEGCLPFLVRMSKVCQLWRCAAEMPYLWHSIDLSGKRVKNNFKNVKCLTWLCQNRFSLTRELNLGDWKIKNQDEFFDMLCNCCKNLRSLAVPGWKTLKTKSLLSIATNLPHLSRLDISNVSENTTSRHSLVQFCDIMASRLTHFVLAGNMIKSLSQLIKVFAVQCPNLELLDISNLIGSDIGMIPIETMQYGCKKLKVLRMNNSNVCLSSISLKDQALSPGFPELEELSAAANIYIDDSGIERILKESRKLRLLDIHGCHRITHSSIVKIPAWDLEYLFLSGCRVTHKSESGLDLIVKKWCHSLVELDLGWSTAKELLDSALMALSECGPESSLKILDLCGSSVSLEPVKAVLINCPRLTTLNISSCRALPRGIKRRHEGVEITELRRSLCHKIKR